MCATFLEWVTVSGPCMATDANPDAGRDSWQNVERYVSVVTVVDTAIAQHITADEGTKLTPGRCR